MGGLFVSIEIESEDRTHNAFQVMRLRYIEQHRMVRRLHPYFDDMDIAMGIECGAREHGKKILFADME